MNEDEKRRYIKSMTIVPIPPNTDIDVLYDTLKAKERKCAFIVYDKTDKNQSSVEKVR